MKINGQAGVLGSGFEFFVFITLHIQTHPVFFKQKKIQKIQKVEHPTTTTHDRLLLCHITFALSISHHLSD